MINIVKKVNKSWKDFLILDYRNRMILSQKFRGKWSILFFTTEEEEVFLHILYIYIIKISNLT